MGMGNFHSHAKPGAVWLCNLVDCACDWKVVGSNPVLGRVIPAWIPPSQKILLICSVDRY